jgi:hypothetical protein
MPQTNVLSAWKATFSLYQKAQKPPGVVISVTLPGTAVPNKAPYVFMGVFAALAEEPPVELEEGRSLPVEEESSVELAPADPVEEPVE